MHLFLSQETDQAALRQREKGHAGVCANPNPSSSRRVEDAGARASRGTGLRAAIRSRARPMAEAELKGLMHADSEGHKRVYSGLGEIDTVDTGGKSSCTYTSEL